MATVRDDKIFPRNYTDPDGKRLVSVYMKRKSAHNGLPRNSASLDESSPSMADPMLQIPLSASQVYYKPSARPVSTRNWSLSGWPTGLTRWWQSFRAGCSSAWALPAPSPPTPRSF